ncbi:MAG: maleylpyruvate isomerase family mycothiol-dependent enzyme [Candidatus Dormibacter sp.]
MSPLTTDEHLARLRTEGERLGEVAAATPLDAPVPGCPGWDVDALLRHIGRVHRWAAAIVRERIQERPRIDSPGPDDRDGLLAWYREGHAQLLAALAASNPDDVFWTWGPAPDPQAFWARRQSHETAIHRLDAEQARGTPTPFPAAVAADGIDELLTLASRSATVPGGVSRSLHIAPTDGEREWQVEFGAGRLAVKLDEPGGDCSVRGPASDLFALVMNRRDAAALEVTGDQDVLRAWRESVKF